MLIKLFQRLFDATRDAIAHPRFDACVQRFGVLGELELLALITDIHAALFGQKIGSLLVGSGAVPVWSRL
jgi:hypothetical protein